MCLISVSSPRQPGAHRVEVNILPVAVVLTPTLFAAVNSTVEPLLSALRVPSPPQSAGERTPALPGLHVKAVLDELAVHACDAPCWDAVSPMDQLQQVIILSVDQSIFLWDDQAVSAATTNPEAPGGSLHASFMGTAVKVQHQGASAR